MSVECLERQKSQSRAREVYNHHIYGDSPHVTFLDVEQIQRSWQTDCTPIIAV